MKTTSLAVRSIFSTAVLVAILVVDAGAATYQYIAQTAAPVLKSGIVVAAGINLISCDYR